MATGAPFFFIKGMGLGALPHSALQYNVLCKTLQPFRNLFSVQHFKEANHTKNP